MYERLRGALFRMDPERAHHLACRAAKLAQVTSLSLFQRKFGFRSTRLHQSLWGLDFASPIGLAAGFDKNAELIRFWQALGFGFVEVGSVTANPSEGNPRPRAFRLPDDSALINRMGLNNDGAKVIADRIARTTVPPGFPVGINLAKTHDPAIMGDAAIEDFRSSFRSLANHASYVALNVSCPNTREGKTFEDPESFAALLQMVAGERKKLARDVPVLVKLSPPPPAPQPISGVVHELVDIALEHGVDGFIACNTAGDRHGLQTGSERIDEIGRGGLSGKPVAERSTRLVAHLYRRLQGEVPIIGVGGVASVVGALAKIEAGASLVELYTGMVYEGPGLASRLARELDHWLEEGGLPSISAAVGRRCDAY